MIPTQQSITDAIYALLLAGQTGTITQRIHTITAPDDSPLPCILIGAPRKKDVMLVFGCDDIGNFQVDIQTYTERMAGGHSMEALHDAVVADMASATVAGCFCTIAETEGPSEVKEFAYSTVSVHLENTNAL
jgi:hypothetical protein